MNYVQSYFNELKDILDELPHDVIGNVINTIHEARISNKTVFIMGNGGSASTASHFVCDLGKNTRVEGASVFRVMGLIDNIALLSALANDHCYEDVFSQQVINCVEPGDVVIGISTSGNSPNVINALSMANTMHAVTIAFTGFDSGKIGSLVDINLHVPSDCIEKIEDIHLILEHLICTALRDNANQMLHQPSKLLINGSI